MKFYSPLRYPGGKRKLTNYVVQILTKNDMIDGTYVEPFAGGANVALSLLFERYVNKVHINDLDPAIYNFWHQVLNNTDELCQKIRDTKVTIKEWHKQKKILNDNNSEGLEFAFALFFLNRTNRSGIIKAGVIGGKNQDGNYKLDARFNKDDLIKRIEKIGRHRNNIRLTNLDVEELLKEYKKKKSKTFLYLDPPYYVKGGDLYTHNFKHEDHLSLSKLMAKIKTKWMVSYDYVNEINEMYVNYEKIIYGINYSVQKRYKGTEVIFFSKDLNRPKVDDPTKVKTSAA